MKKTKIICTIGPSSSSKAMMVKLLKAGLDCARFNFSHGTHDSLKVMMDNFKKAREEVGKLAPMLLDTKGPEIRVKDFVNGGVTLKKGQLFTFDDDEETLGDETRVGLTYHELAKAVKVGTTIMVDDGKIKLHVVEIKGKAVVTKVLNGGKISNHKSINVPGVEIPMPFLSEKDKSDLIFGISQDIDFVAASFTRTYEDAKSMRDFLDSNGGKEVLIVAKIENTQGIKNFEKILDVVDGIMVARGDLGVEIPFAYIPGWQKQLIDICNQRGKIAVVATQMLESMTENPRPTRAEVSDVANAVYDGATAIMLSGESASGKYPVEAVKTMAEIAEVSEKSEKYKRDLARKVEFKFDHSVTQTISKCAYEASEYINAKGIVVFTTSGVTAKDISAYRPNVPVIALCVSDKGARQLGLRYNVFSRKQVGTSLIQVAKEAREHIIKFVHAKKGDKFIMVIGSALGAGNTDTVSIYTFE